MKKKWDEESRIGEILKRLDQLYPKVRSALNFSNPLQLLIATILSAQCTDSRVNLVTPALFKRFQTAKNFAQAKLEEIELRIRSTGFFKNKAKAIQASCKIIEEKYHGEVPSTLEELTELPGVGRKTANVVLGNVFGVPGITVDTHLKRVSYRLGLTKNADPVKIEFDLMKIIPKLKWTRFSHQTIYHGRQICKARRPLCDNCLLNEVCPRKGIK